MKKTFSLKKIILLALAVIFVFSLCSCNKENKSIDLPAKLQKTIRYDFASFRTEAGVNTSPKQVTIDKYFGTCDSGAIALIINSECETYPVKKTSAVIAKRLFEFQNSTPMYIYKDCQFAELSEAYKSGIISDGDVVSIYEKFCDAYGIKVRGDIEPLGDRVAEIIRENYVKMMAETGIEVTVDQVKIGDYLGLYSGSYALFIKSDVEDYSKNEASETVNGIKFSYPDSETVRIYKEGKFYRLKDAYEHEKILTSDDLADICYYLSVRNG